ncbi:MAG: TIGR03936 family radical SAM-associated protein, partial [Candidatus Zophobacter franzmannii]|nr:TIGR03936 family radical SAM-associated protein [Candidatus Zophobacter franzmannii]
KSFTPFQWAGMVEKEELYQRVRIIKDGLSRYKFIKVRYHDLESSMLETILAKGDRRIGKVMVRAVDKGVCFDGWREYFDFNLWKEALEEEGLVLEDCLKGFDTDAKLPWDHISIKVKKEFLLDEWNKAQKEQTTPSCIDKCSLCGVCDKDTKIDLAKTQLLEAMQVPEKPSAINENVVYYYRVHFKKSGGLQYVSHLDFLRMIHRILRSLNLELAYSQGYSPHPKVRFGPPLSVGVQGLNEFFEVGFYKEYNEDELYTGLRRLMADDLAVNRVEKLEGKTKSTLEESGEEIIEVTPGEKYWADFENKTTDYQKKDSVIIERMRKKKIQTIELKDVIMDINWNNGVLTVTKKLRGASIFHILEHVYGISRDETSSFTIIRKTLNF